MTTRLRPLKTAVKTLGDPLFWLASRRELDRLLARYPSGAGSDILAITKHYHGQGWYKQLGAYQVDEELIRLADWAHALRPKNVIEIGTASGATLLMWARVATGQVISIDLPGGIHGGGYAGQRQRLFKHFVHGRSGVQLDLLRADSHTVETKTRALALLDHQPVDVLFIDGDHRLEGVRRDFELWRDAVRPGGKIVFHDILPHARVKECQVDVLWQEIKRTYPEQIQEIVAAPTQGWAGIGILTV